MALRRGGGTLWKFLLIVVTSSAVATDTSSSSGSNHQQVDKPVAVSTITVMAGDRVELNCDVAVTTTMASASAVFDHRRQLIIDQRRGGESLYGIDSRSYVDVDGLHQHRHRRHQRQQKEKQITSSSSSSHLSRRRRASAATRKSGGGGGLTRVNYGGGSDHFIDADTDADDEDDDNGYLVLWFVDPERKPFYSFDARRNGGGGGGNGRHWWDEERFGRRLRFVLPQPSSTGGSTAAAAAITQSARLQIWNVTSLDAGDYRCRVDFNTAPSRNFKYRLYVAEPPTSVVILDSSLQQLSVVAGPLREGDDLILTCKAFGGHPQPWITWWQGGQLLDNTTDLRSIEAVSNLLVVPRIQRRQLHDAFTCQVTSSPSLAPIMKTVTIELNLEPLFVEIVPPVKMNGGSSNSRTTSTTASSNTLSVSVSDGAIEFKCRTAGSRPSPTITWWKGNKQIVPTAPSPAKSSNNNNNTSSSSSSSSLFTSISVTNSEDGNVTVSRLVMTPQPQDDGAHVTCRAKNALIPGAALEDSIKLDVQYAPEVRISLGRTINGAEIKEGDDLYIECHIRSNPPTHKLQWTHNGNVLMHNVSGGVVLSNVSLVLRAVTYARAGLYACSATNSRGETTVSKPPLRLRIQYAPRCRSVSASSASAVSVSGVSKQETASLDCQVDSDPETDVHFWWTFLGTPITKQQQHHQFGNGSLLGGTVGNADAMLLPRSLFSSPTPLSSVLNYSPQSELDFGVLACWASNSVGNQREPCLFHVVPAGRPAAPSNCATNQTADSVRVDCQEAFDGGLQQTFGLELVDRETRTLRYVFNNTKPVFTVYGLEPETAFLLNIYALNAKGRSQPITLETTTLRAAQKLHTAGQQHQGVGGGGGGGFYFQLTPLLGVLVGAAATLLGIVLVVAIVVHRRNRLKREQHQRQQQQQQRQMQPANSNSNQVQHQPLLTATSIANNGGGDDDEDDHHRSAIVLSPSHNRHQQQQQQQQQNGTLRSVHKNGHHGGGVGGGGGKDQPDIILTDSSDFHMMKRTLPAVLQMTSSNCNSLSRSSTPGSVNSSGNGVSVGNENFALLTLHKQQQQQQQQIGSPFRSSPSELMMMHHQQQQSTIGLPPHQYRHHQYSPMTGGNGNVVGGWLTASSNNDNNALMMMTAKQHNNQPESSF